MKKGNVLMIVGGGLLVGYMVVLFVTVYPILHPDFLFWLESIPLMIWGNFVAFTIGNIKAASLGVIFSAGVITLLTGACVSVFKSRARARI